MVLAELPRSLPPRSLPRRDPRARAHLVELARREAPVVLARDRVLPVPGELGALLPGRALQRGAVVVVSGRLGSGATSVVLGLVTAATGAGEWAAAVDLDGTMGGLAAAESGVDLARFGVVRGVGRDRWATVVAALLDGVALVAAEVPRGSGAGDARRLTARARERGTVLVAIGDWPVEAALRVHAVGGPWSGLDREGMLGSRSLRVEGHAGPARSSIAIAG